MHHVLQPTGRPCFFRQQTQQGSSIPDSRKLLCWQAKQPVMHSSHGSHPITRAARAACRFLTHPDCCAGRDAGQWP